MKIYPKASALKLKRACGYKRPAVYRPAVWRPAVWRPTVWKQGLPLLSCEPSAGPFHRTPAPDSAYKTEMLWRRHGMTPVKDALKICRTLVEDTQVQGLIPSITQTVGTHTVILTPRSRDTGLQVRQGFKVIYISMGSQKLAWAAQEYLERTCWWLRHH